MNHGIRSAAYKYVCIFTARKEHKKNRVDLYL